MTDLSMLLYEGQLCFLEAAIYLCTRDRVQNKQMCYFIIGNGRLKKLRVYKQRSTTLVLLFLNKYIYIYCHLKKNDWTGYAILIHIQPH
jgi:hypothetical protein